MSVVMGNDCDLYVERASVFVRTACAIAFTLKRTTEKINITTVDSGRENEYTGGATDAIGTLSGVETLDELSAWQYEDWVDNIGEIVRIRIDFTDSYGDRLRYEMNVLVEEVDVRADVSDFVSFDISFTRSGAETKLKIYDHILVDTDGDPVLDTDGDLIRVP